MLTTTQSTILHPSLKLKTIYTHLKDTTSTYTNLPLNHYNNCARGYVYLQIQVHIVEVDTQVAHI